MVIFYVGLAGALGALARWGLTSLMPKWFGTLLPYGTLAANLSGCFILGMLTELAEQTSLVPPEVRTAIGVGFIGALTTFSTFEFETFRLARRGDMLLAGANFLINIILGFLMIWMGMALVNHLWRLRVRIQ